MCMRCAISHFISVPFPLGGPDPQFGNDCFKAEGKNCFKYIFLLESFMPLMDKTVLNDMGTGRE